MREIPLTKGFVALVDDNLYDYLMQWKWYAHRAAPGLKYYAKRSVWDGCRHKQIHMHRVIAGSTPGQRTDHIDGDGMNNQRYNLRSCTNAQNMCNRKAQRNNTSGWKGVSWVKKLNKWRAQIESEGKGQMLGHFHDPIEAALAYDEAARRLHGEFASTNFLEV